MVLLTSNYIKRANCYIVNTSKKAQKLNIKVKTKKNRVSAAHKIAFRLYKASIQVRDDLNA